MFNGFQQGASQIAQGATLYIFNRKDFSVNPATVTSVSTPHLSKAAQANPSLMMQGFVIDLTISSGNESTSIEFPVNSVSANYPDKGWFVSPDPHTVTREIENMANASKQHLSQNPWHEMVVQKAPSLVMQVIPEKQAEAQQAQRIDALEKQVAESNGMLAQLVKMFSAMNPAKETKEE